VNTLKNTEHDYQVQVIDWANLHVKKYPPLRWLYAIPNGGERHKAVAGKLKAEGVKAGVPDLCLPHPIDVPYWKDGGYHGLYIEMKSRDTKGRLSQEQKDWIKYLIEVNYRVEVCWNAKEAIAILEDYLNEDIS
jgi:hypothetical protein